MDKIVINGDVKSVAETLKAIAWVTDGATVAEIANMLNRMTEERRAKYIKSVVEEYRRYIKYRREVFEFLGVR